MREIEREVQIRRRLRTETAGVMVRNLFHHATVVIVGDACSFMRAKRVVKSLLCSRQVSMGDGSVGGMPFIEAHTTWYSQRVALARTYQGPDKVCTDLPTRRYVMHADVCTDWRPLKSACCFYL